MTLTTTEEIATLLHPAPRSEDVSPETFNDASFEAEDRRREAVEDLGFMWDNGVDPLLWSIGGARTRMLDAEREVRTLLAYAREFMTGQPYTLNQLAAAAGMSISGVRTAYDDEEVNEIERILGRAAKERRYGER